MNKQWFQQHLAGKTVKEVLLMDTLSIKKMVGAGPAIQHSLNAFKDAYIRDSLGALGQGFPSMTDVIRLRHF